MKKKIILIIGITLGTIILFDIGYNIFVYTQYLSIVNDNNTSMVQNDTTNNISITIKKGKNYAKLIKGFISYVVTPQFAIWLEDNNGYFIQTIYATPKVNNINRKAALPVWQHKAQGVDTLSGATPKANSNFQANIPNQQSEYKIFLEVNISYDSNDYYKLGNDYSGQPSLIYSATINNSSDNKKLSLIGHGSIDGSDGKIFTDLNHMTSALKIIDNVEVKINK